MSSEVSAPVSPGNPATVNGSSALTQISFLPTAISDRNIPMSSIGGSNTGISGGLSQTGPLPAKPVVESKIIAPTVGRRVWYVAGGEDKIVMASTRPYPMYDRDVLYRCDTGEPDQPFDAGVVYVHNNRLVNLIVTDHVGRTHPRENVVLVQPGDQPPVGKEFCVWMPYQVGKG